MTEVDKIIDKFVYFINSTEVEPGLENEIPPSLRTENVQGDWFKWKIKPYKRIDWIKGIEGKTKIPFPNSYTSFVNRYIFPSFDIGPISFLGNTPEIIDFTLHELRTGIFEDKILSDVLLNNGYLQFGRSSTGIYDPICFQASRVINKGEFPIVQIDHEEILIHSKIKIVENIAPTFIQFIEKYTGN